MLFLTYSTGEVVGLFTNMEIDYWVTFSREPNSYKFPLGTKIAISFFTKTSK